ncbi:LTA synthase family protein [Kaarinaea lacus]
MKFKMFSEFFRDSRYYPLFWLAAIYLLVSGVTRVALYIHSLPELDAPVQQFFLTMSIGLFYDLVTCLYLFAFYALYLFIIPQSWYQSIWHQRFIVLASLVGIFSLIYLGVVEYFFFDEFDSRFNFVAVSYLIYPHEVFINIWESYPVATALSLTAIASLVLMRLFYRPLRLGLQTQQVFRQRAIPFAVFAVALVTAFSAVDITSGRVSTNRVANELATNGLYSFFYELFHNDLDYNQYYLTIDKKDATERVRGLLEQPNARFIQTANNPLARHVDNNDDGAPQKLNVIMLVQESLGAEFVGAYGDNRGLTPNVDRLAAQSVKFNNAFATGTRTARGLEAISSSFPPIPGESILKRPGFNEHIFTWAQVMRANDYSPTFIYGGYGTFDGMNHFFGNNGFRTIDRTEMEKPKYENIWGVSDEDLFKHAIKVFDKQYARGEKIFSIVMSTSNHKPFTFPEGVPGIHPKGGGRLEGVRYADYAIGQFFEQVQNKPYFDDTVFVIVGDHGARVYGKENIPMWTYELPLIFYSPKHFAATEIDRLISQIDIVPTLLGLLHISYDTVAFGHDVLKGDPAHNYVLLSHNRDVALYHGEELDELGLQKTSQTLHYKKGSREQIRLTRNDDSLKNAASIFQTAYNMLMNHNYKVGIPDDI